MWTSSALPTGDCEGFGFVANSPVLTKLASPGLDFETKPSYTCTVMVTEKFPEGKSGTPQTIYVDLNLQVLDVNEVPCSDGSLCVPRAAAVCPLRPVRARLCRVDHSVSSLCRGSIALQLACCAAPAAHSSSVVELCQTD